MVCAWPPIVSELALVLVPGFASTTYAAVAGPVPATADVILIQSGAPVIVHAQPGDTAIVTVPFPPSGPYDALPGDSV
jgi:hypothetical protein